MDVSKEYESGFPVLRMVFPLCSKIAQPFKAGGLNVWTGSFAGVFLSYTAS